MTIDENASTQYLKGTSLISASTVTKSGSVLVLGTTDSTTITASQVIVGYQLGSSSTAATRGPPHKGHGDRYKAGRADPSELEPGPRDNRQWNFSE